jgi:transposase InsO family protein
MPATTRRSYHSDLKLAVQVGILPDKALAGIPKSSRHRFTHSDYSSLYGAELSSLFENLDLIKEIAASKAALSTARVVLRIASFARSLAVPVERIRKVRSPEVKRSVVAFVERLSSLMPTKKILRFLKLPPATFSAWKRGRKLCPSSPLDRCRKSYPHQLSLPELRTIRKAFSSPEHASWPASSIAWRLINDRSVCASAATICGYAKLLGFSHGLERKKPSKRGSVEASRPNEIWHLDATVLVTDSHEKAYLQFILDNFSRKILAWRCGPSLSGLKTTELLSEAFASVSGVPRDRIDLIVDGGSENNNHTVSAFVSENPIRKLVARIDVDFSNSMIEAVNKIIKYRYIFRTSIPDLANMESTIAKAIDDYNDRPHYALRGLSPNETHVGIVFDKEAYRQSLLEARARRLVENRASCSPCIPLSFDDEEDKR